MNSTHKSAAKVGVFGIGLEAYWAQFAGLRERLEGYQRYVEEQIGRWATIASSGLVDTAPKAQAAGKRFAEERVDLIFCHVGTYATSRDRSRRKDREQSCGACWKAWLSSIGGSSSRWGR